MKAVVGLLVLLLRVSQGAETSCDGRQNGAQCYGALGGTVVLQLMDSATEIFKYQWSNKTGSVLNGGQNRSLRNQIENRSVFTPSNGTFRINNLSRTDDGEYKLGIFDSDGKISQERTLQLTIQAPVSSVLLDTECLSQGELRVSCSSEDGDSPQYSWTLNGHTLTDDQLFPGNNETNIITLKQGASGQLVCSVQNHVSRVSKEEMISTCGFIFISCTLPNGTHISQWVFEANNSLCVEPTTTTSPTTTEGKETHVSIKPSTNITSSSHTTLSNTDEPWYFKTEYLIPMVGALSVLVILLMVGVAVMYAHKKKQNNKPKAEDDEQELTYADVKIVQQQRQRQQMTETQVEYGQIKFSEQPRQTASPPRDECVYAMVRRGT